MNDDELLTLLAQSLAGDQPPAEALDAAYDALQWRTVDADLATLLEDGQVEVALFDAATYSRVLSYMAEHGSAEVRIDDDRFELVVRPAAEQVILRRPSEHTELVLDGDGRTSVEGVSGPIRFEITWPNGSTVTPWITL